MNLHTKPFLNKIRWLIWPQIGLAIFVSIMAYLGKLPLRILALPYADKVMHFLLFGLIAFWLIFWGRKGQGSFWKQHLPVLLLLFLIFTEESLQSLSPRRSFDFVDMGCDLAGVIVFWIWGRKINSQ